MNSSDFPTLEQLERERRRLSEKRRFRRTLCATLRSLLVLLALAVLVTVSCLPILLVQGSSMEPALREGDAVLCIRGSSFERGDVVAFNYGTKILIKRVIAGPGDRVDMDEKGGVYCNDRLLSESYVSEKAVGKLDMALPCTVPADSWFLMGDERSVSVDSRSTLLGFVSTEQIIGRVYLRIWPLWDIGGIS